MNITKHLKFIVFSMFLQVLTLQLMGQAISVSGVVLDANDKSPVIGAAISIKGEKGGVTTDLNGQYTIQAQSSAILVCQSLGYETQEIKIAGRFKVNISLSEKAQKLEEVVVTALGMKREEKALGYAISKVSNEEITNAISSNWLNGMSGKVAGLNFDQASTGPGGSIRVTLRGESSINLDNNTALFVVDGIPISSGMTAIGGSAYNNGDAPVDYGNGASDINPEDIETVTVLKGPSATALYGSRAANGAIIITTKSGMKVKGLGVTFSSTMAFEKAGFWPDFQTTYGPGNNNQEVYSFYNVTAEESTSGEAAKRYYSRFTWGPKYNGQMFYQYASKNFETGKYTKMPFVARDWYKGFFNTGITKDNTVTISGNNGKGSSIRASFTNMDNEWIVPNTGYNRKSFSVSFNQEINKYIEVSTKVNYYNKQSDNLPMTGYSTSSPTYTLMWSRNNVDIDWYYDEWKNNRDGQSMSLNALSDNPYMQAYEQLNSLDRNRVFGNFNINVNISKSLSLIIRSGVDLNREFRTQQKPKGSLLAQEGFYREQTVNDYENNNDFLLNYNKKIKNFAFEGSFGGNSMMRKSYSSTITAEQLQADNVYNLQNAKYGHIAKSYRSTKAINSLYGRFQIGYRNYLFLDITGRNDWSSTLAPENNSYFYPSVSASAALAEILKFENSMPWFNFLKIRASWANVGNDTKAYQLLNYYGITDFTSGSVYPTTWATYNLKPENTSSYEVGFDARMFNNRIKLDVAYYNSNTTDQIIEAPVDYSTGVSAKYINAGKINNKGIEVGAEFTPFKSKRGFNWEIGFTWSKNWNKVVELAPGVDTWLISSGPRGEVRATVGGTLGDFYGNGYELAPEGSYILDGEGNKIDVSGQTVIDEHGYPIISNEYYKMGNTQPDWRAGMTHSLTYRNFKLNMSFSAQWGGLAYSLTHAQLASQGKLNNTIYGRYDGLIHQGVVLSGMDGDGKNIYTENNTVTESIITYYNERVYSMNNALNNTFDTSFLKMKELRLEYSVPKFVLQRTKVLQGATLAFFATNLFCITNFPQYDPEIATMNGSSITKGFETAAYPMTRTFGIDLKLQF